MLWGVHICFVVIGHMFKNSITVLLSHTTHGQFRKRYILSFSEWRQTRFKIYKVLLFKLTHTVRPSTIFLVRTESFLHSVITTCRDLCLAVPNHSIKGINVVIPISITTILSLMLSLLPHQATISVCMMKYVMKYVCLVKFTAIPLEFFYSRRIYIYRSE